MDLEVLELYPSPWSERLRWVLDLKGVSYRRRNYQPIADETELRKKTGLTTVPVLFVDGDVVGDSDAAVDWIEDEYGDPALMPADPNLRAQVRAFELAATEVLAPSARLIWIGRCKAMNLQPIADHFAGKYGWSPDTEKRGERLLRLLLAELTQAVTSRTYLVGKSLTRADVSLASMLITVFGHPAEEIFSLDPAMRAMFGLPICEEPELLPLRRWRDELYSLHRGRRVVPA